LANLAIYAQSNATDGALDGYALDESMELILGLPPMTQHDAMATPMYNVFTTEPSLAAYMSVPARVDLLARNPATGEGAQRSARLDWSEYDLADFDELNEILWKAIKGDRPAPAPAPSALQGQ
jgi:hypothetical protein